MKEQKERLQKRLEKMQKVIPDTIEAMRSLPELEFLHLYATLGPGQLRLQMDYNVKKYKMLRKKLGANWIYQEKHFNNHIGAYFIEFKHKILDVSLDIELDMSTELVDGQSCRLVEIDKRPAQPVYKVECE
jgi:hypothetical protein